MDSTLNERIEEVRMVMRYALERMGCVAEAVVALADELAAERERVRGLEAELALAQVALANAQPVPVVTMSATTDQEDACLPSAKPIDTPPVVSMMGTTMVGRPITRQEAIDIARQIGDDAEAERQESREADMKEWLGDASRIAELEAEVERLTKERNELDAKEARWGKKYWDAAKERDKALQSRDEARAELRNRETCVSVLEAVVNERDAALNELAAIKAAREHTSAITGVDMPSAQDIAAKLVEQEAELTRVRELLLDTLNQATGFDGGLWGVNARIPDMGLSAYEEAAYYLEGAGILNRIGNGHVFKLAETKQEGATE
jgi:hypothetical protein